MRTSTTPAMSHFAPQRGKKPHTSPVCFLQFRLNTLTVKVSPPRTCDDDDDSGSRISPGSSTSSRSKPCAVLSLLPLLQEMPFPVVWPGEGKFLNDLNYCVYLHPPLNHSEK